MKILGIIPARAGSKRVPGKNLRLLGGKPLVQRTIETALGSPSLTTVAVSSDDPAVLEIARRYPQIAAIPRPAELAGDHSPAIDYVRHVLAQLDAADAADAADRIAAVVILQPSSPLTEPRDVEGTIALLLASGADSAVSVVRVEHALHPAKLKRLVGDRLLPYLEDEAGRFADHELPPVHVRNCAVYATRRAVIDRGEIIGADCRGYVMPRERSIDINDEVDLAFAEFLMRQPGR